jgi:hypothetical protein
MKRSDLYVFWNLRDDGGFWRVDAVVYRKNDPYQMPTYKFDRSFEKDDFDTGSVAEIMDRAEEYLVHLIKTDANLAKWSTNPGAAA